MLEDSGKAIERLDMEPLSSQAEPGSDLEGPASSAFQWEVPDKSVTIHIDFDLVDRLGQEIMRGFGAVPKRGAEVGGILLGSAEMGDRTVVRIEDFVGIPCEHLRGPSYVLSERDMRAFDEALERCGPASGKPLYAVGYYRSNTRELLQLCPEDLEILETRFTGASAICLLVRPYAARVSEATVFFRQNGRFPAESQPADFPFRRMEMGGGEAPRRPRGIGAESIATNPGPPPVVADSAEREHATALRLPAFGPAPGPADTAPAPWRLESPAKPRAGRFWIPLSFIFLLLGVVIGFQLALTFPGKPPENFAADPYLLELTVVQLGESLHLKWNPEAAPFRTARRGVLHIQDGDNNKEVELKQEDLSRGGAIYRRATANVKFRLEIFPRDGISVTESVGLRLLDTRK